MPLIKHNDDIECPLCEFKLRSAYYLIAEWFRKIKKTSYPHLHISCSYRNMADQEQAFKDGKCQLHYPHSPHNFTIKGKPYSLALDLFVIDEDGTARFPALLYKKIDQENRANQEPIFWGGRWKTLGDYCHFQVNKK